jgi:two-component system, LytTR family, sensor kinase
MKKSGMLFLHFGYWLMYLLLIVSFLVILPLSNTKLSFKQLLIYLPYSPVLYIAFVPAAIGFYAFYTFMFNRYLKQRKIILLFLVGIFLVYVIGAFSVASFLFFTVTNPHTDLSWTNLFVMVTFIAFLSLVHGVLGLVMRGFIVFYADIKIKEELSKKNFEVELALVKSQISPHFLFNTLNNIDILIEKDAIKASRYLNQLSEMMRFMLYETKTEKIPLIKELDYIEKYIALQKIRTANDEYMMYHVEGDPSSWNIEPMLFIPIIENAFKHAENKKIKAAIRIEFSISAEKLIFTCVNRFNKQQSSKLEHSGLGNDLIKRRLDLLLRDRYIYEVKTDADNYNVQLVLFN